MNSKKNLKRNLLICLLAGSAVMYTLPLHAATSVIGNGTLPTGENSLTHNHTFDRGNLEMTITQSGSNGIIKWDSFDVGGSATVNFRGDAGGYNVLNYVNGANASQIYGTINANNNGNIFIVNPAGVQIGNSAQINVGSLYVSNQNLDTVDWSSISANTDVNTFLNQYDTHTNAELMSLGNINITNVKNGNVTFEGNGRIVIDTERIKKNDVVTDNFIVKTDDENDVLLGYDAYNTENNPGTYDGMQKTFANNVFVNNSATATAVDGYMWVENVEQLQAINTNLEGNYALRNSIDATSTATAGNSFISIGSDNNAFIGKFDGIDYNIFGLTIDNNNKSNTGLFGETNGATINNVTLVGGKITGGNNTGALVGHAINSTITNVVNSAEVNGDINVGGFIGASTNSIVENAVNTGSVHSDGGDDNKGGIVSSVGGLIGSMTGDSQKNSQLTGNSYNLGNVSGNGYNVGGLVGHAVNSTIGDGTNLVYNRLDVTGAYNVGGIVGNMEGSTVQYAENSGTVLASGSVTDKYNYHTDIAGVNNLPDGSSLYNGIVSIDVNVANVGGIAGTSSGNSIITDVLNTGDISSGKGNGKENIKNQEYNYEYYTAGNVGGIVGSAADTNITNATNRENEIRGAHNVGGVVGYFNGTGTIDKGINDGGDIMATGARNADGFVMESVRQSGDEDFIIGNIGGIVGYMEGNDVKVTGSANRGTVHTENIEDADNVLTISKAANVGGIVGKIDANTNEAGLLTDFRNGNYKKASVSNSYNTGNVTGYTGVGGVIGMMYNGSVAGSYNQGAINTTRQVYRGGGSNIDPLNMGGIVGDTTEQTSASAVIYDVYNEGQIGDEDFEFYARHVGGIVGRLSGTVEKAYNTGDIYNNDTAVGGIVGWWYNGNIKNVFNTGNITVRSATELQVGGIAGAAAGGVETLENAYNLGTIRGYKEGVDASNNPINGTDDYIYVGGIIGKARGGNALTIRNVYTMGNLYAGVGTYNIATGTYSYKHTETNGLGAIYGGNEAPILQGANYIIPDSEDFKDLLGQSYVNVIEYSDRYKKGEYVFVNVGTTGDIIFDQKEESGAVEGATDDNWRIYEGSTTPILNAFLPNVEDYFDDNNNMTNISTIQYGTAYNPLLTIINATGDLSYDWNKLGISGAASLAVYGGGLTLDNVDTSGGTGYYSGLLYTDKDLTLIATNKNNEPDATKVSGDIGLGSGAELYGSSVKIEADGTVTVYGSVTATGETTGSTGDINIKAGDVDVYGTLTTGKSVSIAGIEGSAQKVDTNFENVNNPNEAMIHISERFAHKINSVNGATSNITINAGTKLVVGDDGKPILDAEGNKQYVNIGDGNVNLYFGNKEEGFITTGGNLTVTGTGDVFVDSDLDIAGNVTLTSTGKDGEVLLTLTNIGKVQADRFMDVVESAINGVNLNNVSEDELRDTIFNAVNASGVDNSFTEKDAEIVAKYLIGKDTDKVQVLEQLNNDVAVEYMHDFMHSFDKTTDNYIALNAASGNAKLTVDMWVENSDGSGKFDFAKYDSNFTGTGDGHTFIKELEALEFYINEEDVGNNDKIADASKHVYVEVHNGEQLKGIQDYVDSNVENASDALKFNYALMGDINASDVENYVAIGTKSANGFTGTFDGRGNRIIGLKVDNNNGNAGIFSTIGASGTVKNVNIYSGNFTGTTSAGAVAGVNNGRIEGIVTFGNTVTVTGNGGNAGGIAGTNSGNNGRIEGIVTFGNTVTVTGNGGNAGGIAGTNSGTVDDVESTGSVIAGGSNAQNFAGGLVGTNNITGIVNNSFSNSAVTASSGSTDALGGVVGVNSGEVSLVDSLGITNGGAHYIGNVGGIIGTNSGKLNSAYNESIVSGYSNVGGIIGNNSGTVSNIVNASSVDGLDINPDVQQAQSNYVGGLVGSNSGSVTNGRNNGTITGTNYVGGLVGNNASEKSVLTNLVNDSSASIIGVKYVGGIAGSNAGTITTGNEETDETVNLINRGTITGQKYVGGVVGSNSGTITNANNDVELNVKNKNQTAQYFGGIAGENTGTINNATNSADVNADGATYVGGIVGYNTKDGKLQGMGNSNEGRVEGASYVGGVIGYNEADIGSDSEDIVEIKNSGTVVANDGGAGGIIGVNNGNVTNANLISEGVVTGTDSTTGETGTGGIFGINNGDITNSTLENTNGTITGVDNTGGLIGINTGDIEYSSLKNIADISVDANGGNIENIGGLIGYNTGEITGGRINADNTDAGYYKYQIYNNGTITVTGSGSNIGGLIGNNADEIAKGGKKGSLTAGYNTGAINAENSSNVGGIAGSNEGTIDQVFNTVYNTDGTTGAITGGTNVGGLVGNNSGKLSNAYNTTEVSGNYAGNAVGVNNSSGSVSNVYDITNTDNKLIGSGNGSVTGSYSANESDEDLEGITYVKEVDEFKKATYKDSLIGNEWKFYDGYSNPLLSVFLTKVTVYQDKVNKYMNANKVYNGIMQQLTADDIKNLIESGAVSVKGLTKEEAFEAFNNNNSLISSIGYKDVGKHNDWLYSGQIAETTGNTFNPNNLGYDIELSASIAQAELSISDILANIVYGGNTYTDIAGGSLTGIINNDDVYLRDKNGNKISITSDLIAAYLSGDYAANKGNRNTADVKRDQNNNVIAYEDAISVDGISLGGTASGNYKLTDTTISGDITVTPATLNITLNDIYRIYGDHKTIYSNYDATQTGDYGIKNVSELVNGDQDSLNELIVTAISDGALDDFENPTKTNDVTKDGYKWTGEFSGISNVNSNYTITVKGGNSIVKAKTITIKDLLASIVYGNQDNKGLQINTGASLADGSIVYGDDLDVSLVVDNAQYTTGGAYEDNKGGRTTADVGEYTNSLFVSGLSLTGDKAGNYVLNTTAAVGNIEVTKANLIINVGNAETVYGDAFNDNDYTHTLSGVTNGDSDTVIDGLLGGNYDNTVSVEAGKDTANAGTYKDALGFVNYQQLKNYDVQVENGDVIINKKQITIGANDEQILVGETPNYSGTDIDSVLVNGDSLNGNYHYGVEDSSIESVVGTHNGTIGVWIGGSFYDLSNPDWSNLPGMSFFANYNVTFEPGTLTVSAYDIPEDWPHNRWDYLFNDAPFDRNKDFRERKAEVNFVDGGMEI